MNTFLLGLLGTVAGAFIAYLGSLLHKYYIKEKIEKPGFWVSFWYVIVNLVCVAWPLGMIIHYYLYKPFDKWYVIVIAMNFCLILFGVVLYLTSNQAITLFRNSTKNTTDLVGSLIELHKASLTLDQTEDIDRDLIKSQTETARQINYILKWIEKQQQKEKDENNQGNRSDN